MKDAPGNDRTDDIHDDAALYAVDALDPVERAAFELHLRGCAACRAEVAAFGAVGARLASAVAEPPPPELRANVLEAVRAARRSAQQEASAGTPNGTPAGATVVPLADRRRPRRRWLAAAAAAVLLPAAALGGWAVGTQTEQREQQLLAQQQEQQNRLLGAPDVTTRQLEVDGRPATLVLSAQEDTALFVASDLARPAEDQEYQLWLVQGETAVPDVSFGGGQVQVWLDGDVARAEAVAMTVEPAGGSETPTLPVLAAAEI